jgi:hypothetical protein
MKKDWALRLLEILIFIEAILPVAIATLCGCEVEISVDKRRK